MYFRNCRERHRNKFLNYPLVAAKVSYTLGLSSARFIMN